MKSNLHGLHIGFEEQLRYFEKAKMNALYAHQMMLQSKLVALRNRYSQGDSWLLKQYHGSDI